MLYRLLAADTDKRVRENKGKFAELLIARAEPIAQATKFDLPGSTSRSLDPAFVLGYCRGLLGSIVRLESDRLSGRQPGTWLAGLDVPTLSLEHQREVVKEVTNYLAERLGQQLLRMGDAREGWAKAA